MKKIFDCRFTIADLPKRPKGLKSPKRPKSPNN
jgi:hypothetical protein